MQPELNFTTQAPINVKRLSGQNKRLYDYLQSGKSINCFSKAMWQLHIGYLNSRISDLINVHGVPIRKKRIQVLDFEGKLTTVTEYSIEK